MANRRALVKRRKAVRNTRKITRTMQLIATTQFQSAFRRATATQPYTRKLAELAADLSRAAGGLDHPLMRIPDSPGLTDLVVLTSHRGLCGGYNGNVLKAATQYVDGLAAAGQPCDVRMVGRKGIAYFKFQGLEMADQMIGIGDSPTFESVQPIADLLMERFVTGVSDGASVAYMKFISTGRQIPVVESLLPLSSQEEDAGEGSESAVQYEFSPSPQALLGILLPATVRARLFQAFADAAVSEQVSRMVAMKAATDAAGEMDKSLTQQYNRARQTAITMELLDIVGGVNALQ